MNLNINMDMDMDADLGMDMSKNIGTCAQLYLQVNAFQYTWLLTPFIFKTSIHKALKCLTDSPTRFFYSLFSLNNLTWSK
jgi:hypothetical protein